MRTYRPRFDDDALINTARNRGVLAERETFDLAIGRVSSALAAVDRRLSGDANVGYEEELTSALSDGRLGLSSQLLAGAGRSTAVAACTVLRPGGSSDHGKVQAAILGVTAASLAGMGCGIDVTEFNDPVSALNAINQAALDHQQYLRTQRRRPPALMVTCDARHPRITEFVNAKRNVDLAGWVTNISVRFSGDADELARLLPVVADSAHVNGEPGVLFQDEADRDNPTPQYSLDSTAPCAEVFLARGERRVFVTVNLAAHVDRAQFQWNSFYESVRLAVRTADNAVELAAVGAPPIVLDRRRVGVGICGYHTALIDMRIPYANAVGFADALAERLTFVAHSASAGLAVSRGAFPAWEGSRWRSEEWLNRKSGRRSGGVAGASWFELTSRILKNGVRNASIVAFPPTGFIADILGVSRSYEPHFTLVGRTRATATTALTIVPEAEAFLADEPNCLRTAILSPTTGYQVPGAGLDHVLACARQLPAHVHLAVHAAFCGHADESGSKTVNLPSNATVDDIASLFNDARRLELKGLTVFRDKCLDDQGEKRVA